MKLPHRRRFLHLAASAAALSVASGIVRAGVDGEGEAPDGRRVRRQTDENHCGTPIPQRGSSPNPTKDQANPC
jgi:hypothetical protein